MRPQLREVVLRISASLGLVAGSLYGWNHQAHVTCNSHGSAATAIGRCTNRSLIAIGLHWGIALGGGLLLGAVVGLLLALSLTPKTAA
jgi:hypothetical protein